MTLTVGEKIAVYENLRVGGSITKVGALPFEAQCALAWYMSVDGEGWEVPEICRVGAPPIDFTDAVRQGAYDAHRNERIGFHPGISVVDLKKAVMLDCDMQDYPHQNFEQYHERYLNIARPVDHDVTKPLWPIVLASVPKNEDDAHYFETLQDGWHRFHCYVRKGVQKIPALYFWE